MYVHILPCTQTLHTEMQVEVHHTNSTAVSLKFVRFTFWEGLNVVFAESKMAKMGVFIRTTI